MSSSRFFWKLVLGCRRTELPGGRRGWDLAIRWLQGGGADPPSVRRWVWGLVAVQSIGVFGLSYWFIGWLLRPIAALNEAADAIAAGDYQHRVYVPSRDELGTLAATLNRMSQSLDVRMTQLSETAARQSTVLGGMIEGVIAVDARQRIVLANEAAGRLYEFRPSAVEGRPLLEVVRNHALNAAVTTSLATGTPQRIETRANGRTDAERRYSRPAAAGRAVPRRRARDSRYDRAAAAGIDSPRLRRQRFARAENAAQLDQGVRRNAPQRRAGRSRNQPASFWAGSKSRPIACIILSSIC